MFMGFTLSTFIHGKLGGAEKMFFSMVVINGFIDLNNTRVNYGERT
jgi:hypothetical protein